jgi:hypothetical protein
MQVTGDPTPTVRWLRNGQPVPNCPEVKLIEVGNCELRQNIYVSQEGNGVHTLCIHSVESADAGQFTALAENSAGEARSTADLVVRARGAPPTPYYHLTKVGILEFLEISV